MQSHGPGCVPIFSVCFAILTLVTINKGTLLFLANNKEKDSLVER